MAEKTNETVKKFWDDQARQFGQHGLATSPDIIDREMEVNAIARHIKNGADVLDIGCGNGYSTVKFAQKFNKLKIVGIDYSEEMIRQANASLGELEKNLKQRIRFDIGDVLTLNLNKTFDVVTTDRCLINLISFGQQKKAILNINKLLKKGGLYLMCENSLDGLRRINSLRKIVGLSEITVRWHNLYFQEKPLLNFLSKYFKVLEIDNFESLYYIASRILNAKLTPDGQKPDYNAEINRIAAKLPSVGDYGLTKVFVLKKK